MRYESRLTDGRINVFADARIYSRETVFRCLYWYGDKFSATVSIADPNTFEITLQVLQNTNVKQDEFPLYLQKLERDLIDFQLRTTIAEETRNIRDLLVAKAFSHGEYEEEPPGEVSDPVGFVPHGFEKRPG